MSTSQLEADLREENRELRTRLQGAIADLGNIERKLTAALDAKVLLEESLKSQTIRVRQLEAEKKLMWDQANGR